MKQSAFEHRVQAYGKEIFARLGRDGPVPLTPAWLDDRMMRLITASEPLKIQLFRFVDALPGLIDNPGEVARHLREYLREGGGGLPVWARGLVNRIPDTGLIAGVLSAAARFAAERMAHKFIAGSTVGEALDAVDGLRSAGLAFTLDLLGEATVTETEADAVQTQYLELIAGLTERVNAWPEVPEIDRDDRGPIPRVNVSVKLSALYSLFDPIDPAGTTRAVLRRLRPILALARRTGAFVNFDMEQHDFKDATLHIFRTVLSEPDFRDWPHVGIAIQAYLRETEDDLAALLKWARDERQCPVWVRLVKGAYWDYETARAARNGWPLPVWQHKWESDDCFERCTRLLLENHKWLLPAFGTHNVRSIAHALAAAEALSVPERRYELQMLFGMADPVKDTLSSMGRRVRVYTPFGKMLPGMAYLVRRLLENTSNQSFLRASFADCLSEEELLRDPSRAIGLHPQEGTVTFTIKPTSAAIRPKGLTSDVGMFRNEPFADFSREENRRAMSAALASIRNQFGRAYHPVIAGRVVETAELIDSVNPSRFAEVVGRFGRATSEHANEAVAAALRAYDTWRDTAVEDRADLLRRVADGFRRRRWELAAWIVFETGKSWREADADVCEAIDFCEFYAAEALRIWQPRRRDVPGEENAHFYEPRGVAVVIAPWNFPLAILTGMTAAALVTGNTVVMKPAEQSAVIGAKLTEVLREAGFPPGVVNFLPGVGEEIGPTLVNHPDVALIAFTGSLNVGLSVNELAAKTPVGASHVKRVIAEMGGKNAIIVDADADLDEAVRGVVESAFGYAGQKCSACSRAIVLDAIHDRFLERLVEAARSLTIAPADDPGCAVGPVIDAEARDRILRFIARGKHEASQVCAGEVGNLNSTGYFVGPHIFADVTAPMEIAQEEIFGPILAVMRASDLEDALSIANATRYALTGGLFSRSPAHIAEVKRRFRVGNLYINRKCTGALVDRQPFGGFKLSGIGSKAGGPDYLLQFVLPRTVTENTLRHGFAPEITAGP